MIVTGGPTSTRVVYAPFGKVVAETAGGSTAAPDVGFTGQRFEASVGIYDYGARWYNPDVGHFLTPDALVPDAYDSQLLNRYAYVRNNPINKIDPTGNAPIGSGGISDDYLSSDPWADYFGVFGGIDPYQAFFGASFVMTPPPPPPPPLDPLGETYARALYGEWGDPITAASQENEGFFSSLGQRVSNGLLYSTLRTDADLAAWQEGLAAAIRSGTRDEYLRQNPVGDGTKAIFAMILGGLPGASRPAGPNVIIKSEHFAGNLTGLPITPEAAAAAARVEVQLAIQGASSTGNFWGRFTLGGVVLEYRAFTLADGTISVGTIYPVLPK